MNADVTKLSANGRIDDILNRYVKDKAKIYCMWLIRLQGSCF